MPFPTKLLNEGEELVLDLRPHPWFFAGPALALAGILLLDVVVIGKDLPDPVRIFLVIVTLAALVWFAVRYGRWATTNLAVTSDRIVFRSGLVAKRGIEIPLERVNTIFSKQRIFERLIHTGDLVVESGGEMGRETFYDIPYPQRVQNELYQQIEAHQRRASGGSARTAPDALDQLAKLDDLRKRGAITEAEFQAKKAQLLDRM
ncbi:MAG TPA: PH domain-containing protein [Acidimicrobiales bacterium]